MKAKLSMAEVKAALKEANQILKDAKIVIDAREKCGNSIKKTEKFLTIKYGEEKSKFLVEQYFNCYDSDAK
jgi:hypothetical protein